MKIGPEKIHESIEKSIKNPTLFELFRIDFIIDKQFLLPTTIKMKTRAHCVEKKNVK